MRRQVVEVQCSRCERVEYRDLGNKAAELGPGQAHVFLAKVFGETAGEADLEVKFEELCGPCKRTVRAMLEQLGKRIEGVSPDRTPKDEQKARPPKAKKEGQGPAAPPPSPPNGGQASSARATRSS